MKTIKLYGSLAKEFGEEFRMAVHTPAEAFRALALQLPKFSKMISEGCFTIVRGKDLEAGVEYDESTLRFPIGHENTLHIVPVTAGAGGNGGVGKIIIGAVIMIAAVVASPFTGGTSFAAAMTANSAIFGISYGAFFMFGMSLMLAGIATMLQPGVKMNYDLAERPDSRPSFFIGGQINRVEQGGPVTLVFGHMRIGSTVISAGLSAESA